MPAVSWLDQCTYALWVLEWQRFHEVTGEDKPFARELSHDLGEGGLKLRVFLDQESLKPGMAVNSKVHTPAVMAHQLSTLLKKSLDLCSDGPLYLQAMLNTVGNSAVGLLLLNGTSLDERWPMRELRHIMLHQNSLPVLYNISYDSFAGQLKQQGEADAEVLQQLERITMVQHYSPEEPAQFRQSICFAVLRRLATVCCPALTNPSASDVFYVLRIRDAVQCICSDDTFTQLRVKDKREAKEWLQSLNVQIKHMEEVGLPPDKSAAAVRSLCAPLPSWGHVLCQIHEGKHPVLLVAGTSPGTRHGPQ